MIKLKGLILFIAGMATSMTLRMEDLSLKIVLIGLIIVGVSISYYAINIMLEKEKEG